MENIKWEKGGNQLREPNKGQTNKEGGKGKQNKEKPNQKREWENQNCDGRTLPGARVMLV